MGMSFRDLKPANVVLHGDGHIRLTDLGSVGDSTTDGAICECLDRTLRVYSRSERGSNKRNSSEKSTNPRSTLSTVSRDVLESPMHSYSLGDYADSLPRGDDEKDSNYSSMPSPLGGTRKLKSVVGTVGYMVRKR